MSTQPQPTQIPTPTPPVSSLTLRAAGLAAVLGALIVLLLQHHEGNIARLNLVSHDFTAPLALGLVFAFVVTINLTLRVFWRGWGLRGGELAVVLTLLTLSYPLVRYYAYNPVGTVGYTHALLNTQAAEVRDLQRANPYEVLPPEAMLDPTESERFLRSIGDGRSLADPADVPWGVWLTPMLFWLPLLLTFLVLSVSLAFTLYPQWAHRELVPFPLAEFAAAMVDSKGNRPLPDIFYNRLFWMGLGLMVFIYLVNGIHAHVDQMIQVPIEYSYYELAESFPFLKNAQEGYSLLRGTFYFTVIAVAVLLPKEISFTSWATWPVMIVATYVYYTQTGQQFSDRHVSMLQMGGYVAMAGLILYGGRWFYLALARRIVGLKSVEAVEPHSLWFGRLLVLSSVGMVAVLVLYGLPADIALLWTAWAAVYLTVTARIVAEMGIPWIPLLDARPLSAILLAFGGGVMGPRAYSLAAITSSLTVPSNLTVAPLSTAAMNAASVEDRVTGSNPTAWVAIPFMAAMLLVSMVTLIWLGYSFEGNIEDVHARLGIIELQRASEWLYALVGMGDVGAALAYEPPLGERWSAAAPSEGFLLWGGVGAGLVLAVGALRMRVPRFPLHPLPLLLLGSWVMSRFWFSFFVGWAIKTALLKIGGAPLFERARPLFIGIVIGQAVVATFWVIFNIAYFWANDLVFRTEWWVVFKQIYPS